MTSHDTVSADPASSNTTAEPLAFLQRERGAVLAGACKAFVRNAPRHYEPGGPEQARRRLETLYDELLAGIADRDVGKIMAYARDLAHERFSAGYDLSEVQTAINTLEEAVWKRAVARQEPALLAETLGLAGTVFGTAKDALAREYVSLATRGHAPSLDLHALFAGGTSEGLEARIP